jgi:phosphate starvation-inducible membrane PsiE
LPYRVVYALAILERQEGTLSTSDKMPLKRQILIVNVAMVAALLYMYFHHDATLTVILICGVFLLGLVNTIFVVRMKRQR